MEMYGVEKGGTGVEAPMKHFVILRTGTGLFQTVMIDGM